MMTTLYLLEAVYINVIPYLFEADDIIVMPYRLVNVAKMVIQYLFHRFANCLLL